jgi:ATP-dependent Lhr-like helicase
VLETEILPARLAEYQPAMLDTLMAAGEVVWTGVEPLGARDGRIALYLTDHAARLRPPAGLAPAAADPSTRPAGSLRAGPSGRAADVLAYLREHGASFFGEVHQGTGGGFPQETVDALWDLVWAGHITNDTLHPLRAYIRVEDKRAARRARLSRASEFAASESRGLSRASESRGMQPFRSRRLVPRTAEGRWSTLETRKASRTAATEWSAALAQQLLTRHGVVTRETVASEAVPGGFSSVYGVLKAMEETGRIRRGYFVGGLGGAQFALPPAVDLLRSFRDVPDEPRYATLAATDPANPYGAIVKWPLDSPANDSLPRDKPFDRPSDGPTRTVGARVILVDGFAGGYLRRGERELLLFAREAEPQRSRIIREVARALFELAGAREPGRQGMLVTEINGEPAATHPTAHLFVEEGFATTAMGLQARIVPSARAESKGLAGESRGGTGIAGIGSGGTPMAHAPAKIPESAGNTRESEHEAIRSSNDKDQAAERDGVEAEHNRGYDEAARGGSVEHEDLGDVDPDSADAENDRDE